MVKKQLTIGLFLEHYDPFISGVISSVKSLRAGLEKKGHEVYIICPSAPGHKDDDNHIIRIPAFSSKSLENTTIGIPNPLSIRRLMKIDFDIIHAQEVFYTSAMGLHIARRQRVPFVQTYHTLWDKFLEQYKMDKRVIAFGGLTMAIFYPFFFGPRATTELFKRDSRTDGEVKSSARFMWRHMMVMANQADAVIVPSHHLKAAFEACNFKRPIAVVPNSILPFRPVGASPLLPPAKAKFRILSVARLSPEKRLDVLLDAMKHLKTEVVELVIIGEGPSEATLKKQVRHQDLGDKVRFLGPMDNMSVRQAMRETDALLLASYDFDNQPMVFNEAFEAGLPIIYCDPRLDEGLNEDNSLLTPKDAAGLAEGIRAIIKKPEQISSAASHKAARFHGSDYAADRTLTVYLDAIKHF